MTTIHEITIGSERTREHPCFAAGCTGRNARMHLAVAPHCNISCNYCLRKHDCVNESRPGVTSQVLDPPGALMRFVEAKKRLGNLAVVGIAGPGDALANWEATRDTLRLIRSRDEKVIFCLSTNGLALPEHVDELPGLGITHLTVTMNAVDPRIGALMYASVLGPEGVLRGLDAAELLLERQLEGIRRAVGLGITVKVNTVLVDGINVGHAPEVARVAAGLGAACQNVTAMIPVPGAVFEHIERVSDEVLANTRARCGEHIGQIFHCRQCRADAVGLLGEDLSEQIDRAVKRRLARRGESGAETGAGAAVAPESGSEATTAPGARGSGTDRRVRIAVASKDGSAVDQHFGHAERFLVYETDGRDVELVDLRRVDAYCDGPATCGESERHRILEGAIGAVSDCRALLALKVGPGPRVELERKGVAVIEDYDRVRAAVVAAYETLAGEWRCSS